MRIVLMMGSDSDLTRLQSAIDVFKKFDVEYEVRVLSAHRTPGDVVSFIEASQEDVAVYICAAGGAAHLAGTVAAHTARPVLGIPMDNPPLGGLDALLATVQMPGGVPVGTLGTGSGGPINAALLAVRIMAVSDQELTAKLASFAAEQADRVRKKDERVRAKHGSTTSGT